MGKKKIKQQSTEEALKEKDALDSSAAKSGQAPSGGSKKIERGRVYINASYNNTIVSVTDLSGNMLAWATSGSLGFSGPKKATPFASSQVIAALTEKLRNTNLKTVDIFVKGVGGGRDSAIRSIINRGFNVLSIKDVTPVPHNGPRPPKVRRV